MSILITSLWLLAACGGPAQTGGASVDAALVAVDDALARGDFSQALQQLDDIRARPDLSAVQTSDVLVDRSVALLQLGQPEQAAESLDAAIARDADNAVAYLNRGALRLTQGQALAAREDFDMAIKLDPEDPVAYRNRSLAWVALNELDAAYVDLSNAMQRSEFDAELFLERAAIWDAKGNSEYAALNELIYATSQNLAEHGEDPTVLVERGLTWFALGEGAHAEDDLVRALELDATAATARLVLAQLYWELEQTPQALAQYNLVLNTPGLTTEQRLDALLGRANAHQQSQDCASASADYGTILQTQPQHLGGTTGLGWVLVNCQDPTLRDAKRALALAQNYLQATETDAWVLAELIAAANVALGNSTQAQAVLRQALSSASLPNPSPQREQLVRAQQEYAAGA